MSQFILILSFFSFFFIFPPFVSAQQAVTPTLYCVGGVGAPPCAPISTVTPPTAGSVLPTTSPIVGIQQTPGSTPSAFPSTDPCVVNQSSILHNKDGKKKKKFKGNSQGGIIELFLKFILWLIELIIKGGSVPAPSMKLTPESETPCSEPTDTITPTISSEPSISVLPSINSSNDPLPPITNPAPISLLPASEDHRAYIHGLDWVKLGGRDLIVYSSNNYPPTKPGGEWMHNIYYSWVTQNNPSGSFASKTLVNASQAQEPASSAVNSSGLLAVTSEDAQFNSNLDQTFGIWNSNVTTTVPYGQKLMPPQGGHSGHIAASGDMFLVSFSDGWVDGGGVDNLGTGDDVFGKIVNANGSTGAMINTAVGSANRDWWPIVAGSDTNWLQVWQRYGTAGTGGGTVLGAVINKSGSIVKQVTIYTNNKYYYHDVQYIPSLQRYLVVGSQNTGGKTAGVAVLLDKNGTVIATETGLPSTVREAQTIINDAGTIAVYPTEPTGAAVLDITTASIALRRSAQVNWTWDYMGTDGMFTGTNRVVFATGTHQGVKFITVEF